MIDALLGLVLYSYDVANVLILQRSLSAVNTRGNHIFAMSQLSWCWIYTIGRETVLLSANDRVTQVVSFMLPKIATFYFS